MRTRLLSYFCVVALLLALAPSVLRAGDDTAAFLDAMRAAGHHGLALEYLDALEASGRMTPETRARLPYERAVTRLGQAQTLTSQAAREAAVIAARAELQGFLSANNNPALAAEACVKLAGALVNGANRQLSASDRLRDAERRSAVDQARRDIQEARQQLTRADELFQQALEPLRSVQPGSPQATRRLQLRFQLAQARLASARTQSELAQTYPADSSDYKRLLESAAQEFAGLYEKYDTQQSAGIGFYAHLYEGRCYQQLGNHRLADGCFEVVASLPTEDPGLRRLVRMGQASLIAGLTAQDKLDEALQRGVEWLEDLDRAEKSRPEALALKYQVAEAAAKAAAKAAGSADGDQADELTALARENYGDAARGFNEHQSDARLKLAALSDSAGGGGFTAETFDEAYQAGVDALNAIYAAQLAGGDTGAALQENRGRALRAFRESLRLANSETPLTRLNDARNKLSYLYWESGDYLRCAVLAEFLATKHPSDPSAEAAAKLALASFEKMRTEAGADSDQVQFASDHLVRLCEFVTRRWAGEPLADSAFGVLLATAIRQNRLEDARAVLDDVAPERRTALQLRLALAAWEQAARSGKTTDVNQRAAAAAELDAALQAAKSEPASASAATAALFLAQARLAEGDADSALALLEDQKFGPLTLAKSNSALIAKNAGVKAEAFRTALQAYLTKTPPRTEDALAMMERLEEVAPDRRALVRTYFGLGVQLQRQIEALSQSGRNDEAKQVSAAFAEFVSRIGDAGAEADWTMQQWMAQTYLKLAEGLDQQSGEQRKAFFTRARDGFQALADRARQDPSSAPTPNSALAARMQLGAAMRGLGEYGAAIDVFAALLAEREMMLDVQKLAAYTLQDWGADGHPDRLKEAIGGTRPGADNKNLIWGWNKLASVTGRVARTKPAYREMFFESWLNVATCRYQAGRQASGEDQAKQFRSARNTIRLLSRQYPDLGGAELKGRFDTLLKKIQRAEGVPPKGLAEFETAALPRPQSLTVR